METMNDIVRKGKAAAPMGGGGNSKYVKIGEDESVTIAPLAELDELVSIDQHEIWTVNPALIFPCIQDGCPACERGDKPKYKAFLPVMTPDGESKIYAFGISVERQLETLVEELGSLKGRVLKIKRTGSGFATKYMVMATGKTVKTDKVEPLDVEAELKIMSAEEIEERMSAVKPSRGGKKAKATGEELETETAGGEKTGSDWEEV